MAVSGIVQESKIVREKKCYGGNKGARGQVCKIERIAVKGQGIEALVQWYFPIICNWSTIFLNCKTFPTIALKV